MQKKVGSSMQVDNIEVSTPTTKLYEALISQDFWNEKFSILAGLHDLNTKFYITNSASLFIGPTYGIGSEFAATGINGPSIFPTTSLAVSTKIQPNENLYLRTAAFDAIAGNPDKPKGTHIHLKKKDGALFIAELGTNSQFGNYGIGLWRYSKKFDRYTTQEEDDTGKKTSFGYYVLLEKMLNEFSKDKNIFWFFRSGVANKYVNPINYSFSSGLVFNEVITGRDNSQLGIALSQAHLSADYRRSQYDSQLKTQTRETAIEITYSDNITPWLKIQPDLQYIFHPSQSVDFNSKYLKNATIIGLKIVATF